MNETAETYLRNAETMARRAIKAREDIYAGLAESQDDYLEMRRQGRTIFGVADAKQKFMTSAKAKALIADNRWNMTQAIMYCVLSITRSVFSILQQNRQQTKLLMEMRDEIRRSRNS